MDHLFDLPIREHWMNKNFTHGRWGQRIREIVLHHNAGMGIDPWQTWQTREASAHFQVWHTGKVDQLVRIGDMAWHAHEANPYSIGIEHENSDGAPNWPISDEGLRSSAKLIGYLCARLDLGEPQYHHNITTHHAIESDGVGDDTFTACPGPYFLNVLAHPGHWYWDFAKAAYHNKGHVPTSHEPSGGGTHQSGKIWQGEPVPNLIQRGSDQYLGLISGPAASHGGATEGEQRIVKMLQQRLIACGFVPGVTDPHSAWADGKFQKPTLEAVTRFQKKHMSGTKFYGQVWYDDWQQLFNL